MARRSTPASKRARGAARPGAARPLPLRLMSRFPLLGPLAVERLAPTPPPRPKRLRQRLVDVVLHRRAPEPPPRRQLPFVAPVIRTVRAPLQRTASVVQVARDVRKPRTRWERLREAAREVLDDPITATRWERVMGLGVALVAGGSGKTEAPPRRLRLPRVLRRAESSSPEADSERGLQARLRQLREALNENAGPRRTRGRRANKLKR